MQGDVVLVRAYGGRPRIVHVWDADHDTVWVCSADNYRRLMAGLSGLWPVAVPREDVFALPQWPIALAEPTTPWPAERWVECEPYLMDSSDS